MINDFCLKIMDLPSATINQRDFIYGLLMGFSERIFYEKYNLEEKHNDKLK